MLKKEIKAIKNVCGERVLKVIIETCLLTDEEKAIMCKIVKNAGADYIKTSTGMLKMSRKRRGVYTTALRHL